MQLIAGAINGKTLLNIHRSAIHRCDVIKVAVAYATNEDRIIDDCLKYNIGVCTSLPYILYVVIGSPDNFAGCNRFNGNRLLNKAVKQFSSGT